MPRELIIHRHKDFSENNSEGETPASAYPTFCTVASPICRSYQSDPYLLLITNWAGLQLTWTIILVVTQWWQIARQLTTLEVSNLGRYGWMGGRGGSSLRGQTGAIGRVTGMASSGTRMGGGQGGVVDVGAGPGPSGAEEEALLETASGQMHPLGHGHAHGHVGHNHHHRFGILGKICATSGKAISAPMLQLLGLDRFTKGKAVQGLMDSSGGGNPFDIGFVGVRSGSCARSVLFLLTKATLCAR